MLHARTTLGFSGSSGDPLEAVRVPYSLKMPLQKTSKLLLMAGHIFCSSKFNVTDPHHEPASRNAYGFQT